ncbi:hypothetical protein F5Y15DRAFT_175762 [Xylariaceae sp. FL0016]|nr:hypothetical protein F5Y15DRAFT_175762 [Xylariaceae sp. FL0016]
MGGFLVPAWFKPAPPTQVDMNVASIIWGFSLSCAIFTLTKAARQTWKSYRRTREVNSYIIMIWAEWIACVVISIMSWLYLWGTIPTSFWFLFFLLCLWVIQIQCIMQIIINRIALLMMRQEKIRVVKWGVFVVISLINISVFCIWIPARLQISEDYIHINNVWDRVEKAIFAIIDVGLNVYFIYLVRAKLISNGLTKYDRLFTFNLGMIVISLALDVILIGTMSLPNGIVYVQFHPLVYLVKLHIEMNIAELIAKVVRASNPNPTGSGGYNSNSNRYGGTHNMTTLVPARNHQSTHSGEDDGNPTKGGGIQRTIETHVVREPKQQDDDNQSESSSTRELQKHFAIV